MELEQRSQGWFDARKGKMTASTLAACLGQVPYTSRPAAYRRVVGSDTFSGNRACQWGVDNEVNGINAYELLTGTKVSVTGLHAHPTIPWIAGSPDGLVGEEGIVEVKCPFYTGLHREVPVHYYFQMNALLEILDRKWCDYVCWNPDGVVIYRVNRDTPFFNYCYDFYLHFYNAVERRDDKPPPLSKEDKMAIKARAVQSMQESVDYTHYKSDASLFDEDEILPPIKRQRTLPVPNSFDDWEPPSSQMAGGLHFAEASRAMYDNLFTVCDA